MKGHMVEVGGRFKTTSGALNLKPQKFSFFSF
jgi:hypothetical protein